MARLGGALELLGLGALFGAMLFFAVVMAPLVFMKLPAATAAGFIRAAFPWYYAFMGAASAVACLGALIRGARRAALVLLAILAITLCLWFFFLPYLDALRAAANTAGFENGHRVSVWIDGAELLAVLALLLRLTPAGYPASRSRRL